MLVLKFSLKVRSSVLMAASKAASLHFRTTCCTACTCGKHGSAADFCSHRAGRPAEVKAGAGHAELAFLDDRVGLASMSAMSASKRSV